MWLTGPVAPRHVGSSQTRARTRVPCISRQILNHCATREALDYFLKILSSVNRVTGEEELKVNKGSEGSPASAQAREAEVGKRSVRGKKAQTIADSRPPQVQGGPVPPGEQNFPPPPTPRQGAYQTRKQVPTGVCFLPTSLLFFLLPSLPPFLPSTFIDHLCVRYCVGGRTMKMIKEFLTSSYQVVKLVINKFNKANNAITSQDPC